MLINSLAVGKSLTLWSNEHAELRQKIESATKLLLISKSFQQVYTPYISNYNKHIEQPWGCVEQGGDKWQYLPKKWFFHLLIATEEPLSYKQLPVKIFEICECYSKNDGIINEPGFVLTAITSGDNNNVLNGSLDLIVDSIEKNAILKKLTFITRNQVFKDYQYTTPENDKKALTVTSWEIRWNI